jgi:hypothetical protein
MDIVVDNDKIRRIASGNINSGELLVDCDL